MRAFKHSKGGDKGVIMGYSRHITEQQAEKINLSRKKMHPFLHISEKNCNFAVESCKAYGTVSFFKNWGFLNDQISKTFRGEKPQPKNIEK